MEWLLSASAKMFDHASAFDKWGYIDWRQSGRKYNIGDIVYIYCTKPIMRVMYKTEVIATNLTKADIVNSELFWNDKDEYIRSLEGEFIRIKLLGYKDSDTLSFNNLKKHGLNGAPQGPIKLVPALSEYINSCFCISILNNEQDSSENFNDCIEGAKTKVTVNKYERNPITRQRCIEHYGYSCSICTFNFHQIYGDIGKNFIHVHHIKPLHEIRENYIVDPIKDLIPVCPNCHAMLHRKIDDRYLTSEQLKESL